MQKQQDDDVWDVRAQSDDGIERMENEYRDRRPVLVVREEQPQRLTTQATRGQELPLVEEEPLAPVDVKEKEKGGDEGQVVGSRETAEEGGPLHRWPLPPLCDRSHLMTRRRARPRLERHRFVSCMANGGGFIVSVTLLPSGAAASCCACAAGW